MQYLMNQYIEMQNKKINLDIAVNNIEKINLLNIEQRVLKFISNSNKIKFTNIYFIIVNPK